MRIRGDVNARLSQLDARLEADGQRTRGQHEAIATLVPNRSIETWIEWLCGREVDESTQYPKLGGREKECAEAVKQLLALIRRKQAFRKGCPPSLIAAIKELDRLK